MSFLFLRNEMEKKKRSQCCSDDFKSPAEKEEIWRHLGESILII